MRPKQLHKLCAGFALEARLLRPDREEDAFRRWLAPLAHQLGESLGDLTGYCFEYGL